MKLKGEEGRAWFRAKAQLVNEEVQKYYDGMKKTLPPSLPEEEKELFLKEKIKALESNLWDEIESGKL